MIIASCMATFSVIEDGKDAAIHSATPPEDITKLWFDTNNDTLKYYDAESANWKPVTDIDNIQQQITTTTKNFNDILAKTNGELQQIGQTVTTTSKNLSSVQSKVLELERNTSGLSAEIIDKLVTTDNLTGLVTEKELKKWIRWGTDENNHSVLTLGSSLYDTQTRIQEDGLYIDVKGAVSAYFAKDGMSTDKARANEYHVGDFAITTDNDGNFIII